MERALDIATLPEGRAARAIAATADITAAYPLLVLGSVYGQWLLSWWLLGHQPRITLDDPKSIAGASWMHYITATALMAWLPLAFVGILANAQHLFVRRPSWPRAGLRLAIIVTLWLGAFLLLRADPGDVMTWWID